jgi:hypothetical protein
LWRFYPRWYLLLSFKERKRRMIHCLTTNCDYVSPHLQDLCLFLLRWMLSNCGLRAPPGVHTCTVAVNPAAVAFGLSGLWRIVRSSADYKRGKFQGELFAQEGKMGAFECGIPGRVKVLVLCKVSGLHTGYYVWVSCLPQMSPRFCNSPQQLVGVRRICWVCKAFNFHINRRGGGHYYKLNSGYSSGTPCPSHGFDINFKLWNYSSLL